MAVKKQPESKAGELSETASEWFRLFLKDLELFFVETGQGLPADAKPTDCCLAAMRAVKFTLLDSGIDDDEIVNLFGRVALENTNDPMKLEWNVDLNRRRFELIDGDIGPPNRRALLLLSDWGNGVPSALHASDEPS